MRKRSLLVVNEHSETVSTQYHRVNPRRLTMHHDRLFDVSEAWVWLAEARILARRLTA
ncbi:hypothetical protein PLD_02135 [Pseudomonas sp. LD120]|nr:hypothetical protein PLD_02135 [Pseudomonas sp. LD120]